MTRKDYEMLAKVMRGAVDGAAVIEKSFNPQEFARLVAEMMAVNFKLDNPRFDRERFLTACGVLTNTKEV